MIHISKKSSKMKKDIMRISTDEKGFPSQEKFLFTSYNKSLIYTMNSTTKLHSVLTSLRFCEQENSSMINGRKHLQTSCSFTSPSVSKKMATLFSPFQHLK